MKYLDIILLILVLCALKKMFMKKERFVNGYLSPIEQIDVSDNTIIDSILLKNVNKKMIHDVVNMINKEFDDMIFTYGLYTKDFRKVYVLFKYPSINNYDTFQRIRRRIGSDKLIDYEFVELSNNEIVNEISISRIKNIYEQRINNIKSEIVTPKRFTFLPLEVDDVDDEDDEDDVDDVDLKEKLGNVVIENVMDNRDSLNIILERIFSSEDLEMNEALQIIYQALVNFLGNEKYVRELLELMLSNPRLKGPQRLLNAAKRILGSLNSKSFAKLISESI